MLDSQILCPKNNYTFAGINKYYEQGVQVTLTTKVSHKSVLGEDCKLGVNSVVERSTLGKRCKVGKNVLIRNSHIWSNVEI